jgi:hypothetical protein
MVLLIIFLFAVSQTATADNLAIHVYTTIKNKEADIHGQCKENGTQRVLYCSLYKTEQGIIWVLYNDTEVLKVFVVTPEGETKVVFLHPSLTI